MKLTIKGEGTVNLTQKDFLASGGQGTVYVKGNTAYKVYHDPNHMLPVGKIHDLSAITDPGVVKPEKILFDEKGAAVGYTMRFIKGASPACKFFTRAFRERNNITLDQMLNVVRLSQAQVSNVHQARVLVVDLNELNVLVADDLKAPYLIDMDACQTTHYPATAIMESIRDPLCDYSRGHASEGSDWFSFAVVSFQFFCGIHPFKGKHPTIEGMTNRMQAHISVFDPNVSVPKAAYPLDVIPPVYKDWYKAVFMDRKRVAPPTGMVHQAVIVTPLVKAIQGTDKLDLVTLCSFSDPVLAFWEAWGNSVAACADGVYFNQRLVLPGVQNVVGIGFTMRMNSPVVAWQEGTSLKLFDAATKTHLDFGMSIEQVMHSDGRIYVKNQESILEVGLFETGTKVIASASPVANCMMQATKLYEGVALQDMLGTMHATLFPATGQSVTVQLPELKGYQIIEAKAVKNVLMVIASKNGKFDRLVFRFSPDWHEHDCLTVADIQPQGLNFTVLDTGVAALLNEDEKLELFSTKRGAVGSKVVTDSILGADMHFTRIQGKVGFWRGKTVYKLSTK